jgi:hypothetical protein
MEAENIDNISNLNIENKDLEINEEDEMSLFSPENSPSENYKSSDKQTEICDSNIETKENELLRDELLNKANLSLSQINHVCIEENKGKNEHVEVEADNLNVSFKFGDNYENCLIIINKNILENSNEDKFNFDLIRKKIHRSKGNLVSISKALKQI